MTDELRNHWDYKYIKDILTHMGVMQTFRQIYTNFAGIGSHPKNKTGNPYKTNHKKLKLLIKALSAFVEDLENSGIPDYRKWFSYIDAKRLLTSANRKLLVHEIYVQKYGIQKTISFKTAINTCHTYVDDCAVAAKEYEQLMICYCFRVKGCESILNAEFMWSLPKYIDETDWNNL